MKSILFILLLLSLLGCQPNQPAISDTAWAKNNQGVGQMGKFDYDAAYQTFAELHHDYPKQRTFHHNWIIATLNRQKADDESNALEALKGLFEQDNNDPVTRYLMGLLQFNQGDCSQATEHFRWVAEFDNSDAYARYFLGQCLLQQGELQPAAEQFESAIKIDPYLRSAYYGAFMTAQRLNLPEVAEQQLQAYQQMELNPQSRLAEIKYTRMGPKAMAQVNPANKDTDLEKVQLPALTQPFDAVIELNKPFSNQVFTVVNQQQKELWVAAADSVDVYLLTTSLQLDRQITAPGLKANDVISITDFNQDGLLDGYITTAGQADRVYINQGNQQWQLLQSPMIDDELPQSESIQIADYDHDGDLDVLALDGSGQVHLINNNGDLSFRLITDQLLDSEANNGIINTALLDVDGDRDLDVLLLQDKQLKIIINDRMWYYQQRNHPLSFLAKQMVVNYDLTGKAWIHISDTANNIHQAKYDAFNNALDWVVKAVESPFEVFEISDVNGDGVDDWLLFNSARMSIENPSDGSVLQTLDFSQNQNDFYLVAGLQGPEILTMGTGSINIWPVSSQRHEFLKLSFTGREIAADSMRSNALGFGTEFTVHSNQQAKKYLYLNQSHHGHQSFGAINAAAFVPQGSDRTIDFLALQWSDGVYQTELDLASGVAHKLTETQRQLSSCPVLFMQQNGEYEFLTDVMGVGAMGFLVGKDQYATPRDWEYLLLDDEQVANSDLSFIVTEPMEETMFLDAVHFKVYETGSGVNAVLDERLATNDTQPTGELMFYTEQWLPDQVISQDGTDTTEANSQVDANPLPVGELDLRFLGYLKQQQVHTMHFDQALQGDLILMVHGWVEYGYSQTTFAAMQAGQALQYPSLDAEVDGQWVNLLDAWGFPAGMPKMAAIEFSIPDGKQVTKLRMRSNQEVYFDQISVAERIYPEVSVSELPLLNARQSVLGFPQRDNGPHRYPLYDFNQLMPFADTRHMTGAYTQLGPIEPLVSEKDNALAIVSGGEGVSFQFAQPAALNTPGKKRFYVMEFYGWAKDMDIMTQNDKYLLPLPHTGVVSAEAKALNQRYNVRFMSGK